MNKKGISLIYKMMGIFCLIFLINCTNNHEDTSDIEMEEGIEVELLVKEPLVIDPVAFAFDETGQLFVVEDRGYPDPVDPKVKAPKVGRIALLRDTNNDGVYDKRFEFAEDLSYPNGVLPWKGGVFVTCAPDIWYLKDTTGDGIADIREKILTGFFDTKTAQIRISHPTLGPDGWVYVSSGLNGGKVYSPLHPEYDTVSFAASDGRFDPETYRFETVGGKSQFGMTFDAYGHRFGVSNRQPILQNVIAPKFLNRNPYLPHNNTVKEVSKMGAEAVVFPISNVVTTSEYMPGLMGQSHKGTFTSASSTYIYYGQGLGEEHQGNAFICESAQNLVQRQLLIPDGASFRSELAYENQEFMASKDQWFRPDYVSNGPDDGLYVVDMNRKIIDHPAYIPEDIRDSLDYDAGKDKGRIYRIVKRGYPMNLKKKEWFSMDMSVKGLVSKLDSDLEWDSETAFRLLVERWEGNYIDEVKNIVLTSKNPINRVRALNILGVKNLLTADILTKALKDEEEGVRERAVIWSQGLDSENEDMKNALITMANDTSMMVRLQAALVLGSLKGKNVLQALAKIALNGGHDEWIREAVLSGIQGRMNPFLDTLRAMNANLNSKGYAPVIEDLSQMFGMGASIVECRHLVRQMIGAKETPTVKFSSVLGLVQGISSREEARGERDLLAWLLREVDERAREDFYKGLIENAKQEVSSNEKEVTAIKLLGYTHQSEALKVLQSAIKPGSTLEVQKAGVQALAHQRKQSGGKILVAKENWKGFSPQIRSTVISRMVSTPLYLPILLRAIDSGVVPATDIPSVTRKRLIASNNDEIKQLAEHAFSDLEGGDRMGVYEKYKKKLTKNGRGRTGKEVFERSCSVCHSYNGAGGHVGPDLTDVKNQPAEAILLHILVPNYEVYPTYQTISIETKDGQNVSGWTVSETDNGITLRTSNGDDVNVLRSNIKELTNTGQSLMPEGLENSMTNEELNDLIAYIKDGNNS